MSLVSKYIKEFNENQTNPLEFVEALEKLYKEIYTTRNSDANITLPAIYSVADQLEKSFGLEAGSLKNACVAKAKSLYLEYNALYNELKNTMESLSGVKF